jgi:ATP-dependent DNA helicase RecG
MAKELENLLQSGEGDQLEFKVQWNDAALESLAAFANGRGGTLLVGVENDGQVKGWTGTDKDLRAIVDQIADGLRIEPLVRPLTVHRQKVLFVQVIPSPLPVAFRGRYFQRIGNTTRQFQPEALGRLFVEKSGSAWDKLSGDYTRDEIDSEALRRFLRLARPRLPLISEDEPAENVLRKLDLFADGHLTRGALLLFGRRPQQRFPMAYLRMGRFKNDITIVDDKFIEGNLFEQLEQVMQYFRQYLQVRYEIPSQVGQSQSMMEAIQRRELWEYPLEALREAVINALIHRDYFDIRGHSSIRVYDDRVYIWNPGELPEGLAVEDLLRRPHDSRPRNPLLARVFYYAGWIEHWGSGTTRILDLCRQQNLPEPQFHSGGGRFEVSFYKDLFTEERLHQLGLNERQVKAVIHLKAAGRITNTEYLALTGVSKPTVTRDLEKLVKMDILQKHGRTGRGTYYQLKAS